MAKSNNPRTELPVSSQPVAKLPAPRADERVLTGRRTLLRSVGAVGLGAALVACGGAEDSTTGSQGAQETPEAAPTPSAATTATTTETPAGGSGGEVLAATSDIPAGGGKIFKDRKVVVTQPTDGNFKAFSAVCQHQGCLVGSVSDGTINCPCHGSTYNIADGSVRRGPATKALPQVDIMVQGQDIRLA